MSYVIYEIESTYILKARARSVGCYITSYKTEGAAKAALTRLEKKGKLGEKTVVEPTAENNWTRETVPMTREDFAIAEAVEFREKIEKKVVVRNLMSGEEYEEAINTPNCCSPASETYWSM